MPKFQIAAVATYGQPLNDRMDWSITGSVQHIGNRFGEPGDQVSGAGFVPSAVFYDLANGDFGFGVNDIGSLRLPAYTIANLSGGIYWDTSSPTWPATTPSPRGSRRCLLPGSSTLVRAVCRPGTPETSPVPAPLCRWWWPGAGECR